MTRAEAQAQMTMWAMVAAPLMLGSDPRKLSSSSIRMLTNPDVIAIDQDPLVTQGTAVRQQRSGQIWVKPLVGGAHAVAILNRGSSPLQITTNLHAIGIAHASHYQIENLWTHRAATTTGAIRSRVAPHAAVLYRITAF